MPQFSFQINNLKPHKLESETKHIIALDKSEYYIRSQIYRNLERGRWQQQEVEGEEVAAGWWVRSSREGASNSRGSISSSSSMR